MDNKILRLREVIQITGMSRSCIYFNMHLNKFPKQIKISERCVGWLESELSDWMAYRADLRTPLARNGEMI